MDNQKVEKCAPAEDGSHLNRNRSFKTKQLVRSQAIRESTSPPRTVSPSVERQDPPKSVNKVNVTERNESDFNHDSDVGYDREDRRKPVEIQITQGAWDENPPYEHCGRAKRWLSDSSRDSTRDLLSNNPRVACVCGACAACPQCRGRRRRHICTIKQDSGICADECPECSDSEPNGLNNDGKKSGSVEVDEQYYCRCPERRDKPKSMLSRTDSDDKIEPTGPELVSFIMDTLNKSGKDRFTLLKIEKELYSLVNDTGRCIVKFPVMTSYGRMLVHRCASLFQLSHHLDQSNKNCVIVSKSGTSGGRIPCTNFKTWCVANFPPPSPQRHPPEVIDGANAKSILKRDGHSLDSPAAGALAMNRSKSLEQREREYERVRRRIFSTDNCNEDESQWPWLTPGTVKLLAPEPGRNKLLKVQSLEGSSGSVGWRGRGGAVSKSHSFGGYGEPPSRTLSRQGDLASSSWRLSPSSSGYKTLSLRSTDSVTPSPTGGGTPEPACPPLPVGPVVWAVTDMSCVPPGAIVLHPQTGTALTNPDGSLYHFDPSNPPVMYHPGDYEETEQPKVDQNNEKRRGRLEKQHSFIDHEGECQPTEQYHYDYEVHEAQENTTEKEIPKPVTPTKPRYEPINDYKTEPTNQNEAASESTNQRQEPANSVREIKAGSYQDTVYYGAFASLNRGYNEEVQSPPQMTQYIQPDMSMQILPQAKVQLVQDHNIRPISLTNVAYQQAMTNPYQYVQSPSLRVDQLQQQLLRYPMLQQQIEEQKVPSPPQQAPENTFRIDSSYPYAPVDYTAAYGGCVDTTIQNPPIPQRSYSVPYNPAELTTAVPPVYPLHNVVPPLVQYPMQYPDGMQWAPLQTQAMCPVVYPQHYTHYNIVYPQVMPQHYPVCQPMYPMMDTLRKRNSLPSSNHITPIITPEEKQYETFDRQNYDIAAKIYQIKEGMLQREGMNRRRDEWKRNSGTGILGSYPINNYNGRISGTADNIQLTSAARAIVNSIRHLQTKNTYHHERRDYSYQRHYDRPDRRRHEDRPEVNGKGDGTYKDCQDKTNDLTPDKTYQDKHTNDVKERIEINDIPDRNCNQRNVYKYQEKTKDYPENVQVKHKPDVQEEKLNLQEQDIVQVNARDNVKNNQSNAVTNNQSNAERNVHSNVNERNVNDRHVQSNAVGRNVQSNAIDRNVQSNATDRNISNVNDRSIPSNVERNVQSNAIDRNGSIPSNVVERNVQSNAFDRNGQSNATGRNISNVNDRSIPSNVERNVLSNAIDRNGSIPSNVVERNVLSNAIDRNGQSNATGRNISSVNDRSIPSNVERNVLSNAIDRNGSIPSNVVERNLQSNAIDRNVQSNATDRNISNVNDRSIPSNVERNVQSNASERNIQSNAIDRNVQNVPERSAQHLHYQDRTHERHNYHDRNQGQDQRSYQDVRNYHDSRNYQDTRNYQERRFTARGQGASSGPCQYRAPYLFRQMTPATWCRRSPAPVHPGINHPRRPHPDNRNGRRY